MIKHLLGGLILLGVFIVAGYFMIRDLGWKDSFKIWGMTLVILGAITSGAYLLCS